MAVRLYPLFKSEEDKYAFYGEYLRVQDVPATMERLSYWEALKKATEAGGSPYRGVILYPVGCPPEDAHSVIFRLMRECDRDAHDIRSFETFGFGRMEAIRSPAGEAYDCVGRTHNYREMVYLLKEQCVDLGSAFGYLVGLLWS